MSKADTKFGEVPELLRQILDRLDGLDTKVDNLAHHQEAMAVEIAAVNTRLGQMETTINKVAITVGVPGLPASDSAGRVGILPLVAAGPQG